MGVPKFFRFMSERYPCINEKLREYQIPEFDNLYLDMNGIIHVCSHPDDNPLASISEETIFKDIFYYIELMFRLIQPKKLFMMAVDGVAPRAKMNQQRGRRFRTARDAELAATRLMGTAINEDRFDSNCITPGTEFMDRLHKQLEYFIIYKVSTDKLWRRPNIILSGHDTPGEGEHKIMDYIRYLRTRDDWEPNTRHCLHGLDADLIMLGLCSHELHFSLLREEVKFGRNQKRPTNPEEIQFFLLHLSLMRDYLGLEFQDLKKTLPFPFELEKVIDDWVLMGFLVGNDFIPNLPSLHINENALHTLYELYIEVLPSLGGYINEGGVLNMERFEKYLEKLADLEYNHFKELESDLKHFDLKSCGEKKYKRSLESIPDEIKKNDELMNMINETKSSLCQTEKEKLQWEEQNSEADLLYSFKDYKAKYYKEKMNFTEVNDEVLRCQAECYIRAIQWNLHYYYHGCPSWSWYYPYHYAPFISDVKDFCYLGQLEFDVGSPFLPFQQLLGVLPPASRKILPVAFQHLMISKESPIVRFYPDTFETDLNGKLHDWEAIVLLPFIDQDALVAAMAPYFKNLSRDEQRRNKFGPMTVYKYTEENLGIRAAPDYFPAVQANHAEETKIEIKDVLMPKEKLILGSLPGAQDSFWYGFPTLKNLPFTAKLKEAKVKVFQQPSNGYNMMLYLKGNKVSDENNDDGSEEKVDKTVNLKEIATKYLGKELCVGWPHLVKAFATTVSNGNSKFTINKDGTIKSEEPSKEEMNSWLMLAQDLSIRQRNTLGIEIGKVKVIVFAKQLMGTKYVFTKDGEANKKLIWSTVESPYPLQTIIDDVNLLPCEKICGGAVNEKKTIFQVFPPGQIAFSMKTEFYGSKMEVLKCTNKGTLKVKLQSKSEPNIDSVIELKGERSEPYYQGSVAANMCGLTNNLLSRITGTIYVQTSENDSYSSVNVGLNMKFNKFDQELVGYTKKVEGKYWNYSQKAIDLVKEYIETFPIIYTNLSTRNREDKYKKNDFFETDADEKLQEITKWISNHPFSKAERRTCNSDMLGERAVNMLENIVTSQDWNTTPKNNSQILEVNPEDLILPVSQINLMEPDPQAYHQVLDRVISIRESHPIPLGMGGFIIGIEKKEDDRATLYDILFDVPILGAFQLHTKEKRCYRLTRHAFINLSHGRRKLANLSLDFENSSNKGSKRPPLLPTPTKMQYNLRPDYSSGANNVTKFFSAYRSPNFANTLNQQQSPNRGLQSHQQPNANSEFQAMWHHLQALGRSPVQLQKNCNHSLSCCAALINYCQRTGRAYPIYGYVTNSAKEVSAVMYFPDGMQFKGLPAKDKHAAAENAACLTLKSLTEGKQFMQGRQQQQPQQQHQMVKTGGNIGGTNLMTGQQQAQQLHQQSLSRLAKGTCVPSPPDQWCQQPNKRENWRFQEQFQDRVQQHRPSPSFTANNFVPLQAQMPRLQHQQQNNKLTANPTSDTTKPQQQQKDSVDNKLNSSSTGGIDKSSTTSNNVNELKGENEKQQKRSQDQQQPHLIDLTTDSGNGMKQQQIGIVGGIITNQQPQKQPEKRKPMSTRSKPRIAARFSKPLIKE